MAATLFVLVAHAETGIVVDTEGKPVAQAMVDPGNFVFSVKTDADGRFDTKSNDRFVVRKEGFQSELVTESAPRPLRIELKKAESWIPPSCAEGSKYWKVSDGDLAFPEVLGVSASRMVSDVDYGARTYSVNGGRITHGSGPSWSWGTPSTTDLKETVTYRERLAFRDEFLGVVDARGETRDGKHWRYVGKFGESASYFDVTAEVAATLDRVLDGLCIADK